MDGRQNATQRSRWRALRPGWWPFRSSDRTARRVVREWRTRWSRWHVFRNLREDLFFLRKGLVFGGLTALGIMLIIALLRFGSDVYERRFTVVCVSQISMPWPEAGNTLFVSIQYPEVIPLALFSDQQPARIVIWTRVVTRQQGGSLKRESPCDYSLPVGSGTGKGVTVPLASPLVSPVNPGGGRGFLPKRWAFPLALKRSLNGVTGKTNTRLELWFTPGLALYNVDGSLLPNPMTLTPSTKLEVRTVVIYPGRVSAGVPVTVSLRLRALGQVLFSHPGVVMSVEREWSAGFRRGVRLLYGAGEIVSAIVGAVVVFFMSDTERQRYRRQMRRAEQLRRLLREDLSEGCREFVKTIKDERGWLGGMYWNVWKESAPDVIRKVVETVEGIGSYTIANEEWEGAFDRLDLAWQEKIIDHLMERGKREPTGLIRVAQERLEASMRAAYPEFSRLLLSQHVHPSAAEDPAVAGALEILGLSNNPFDAPCLEEVVQREHLDRDLARFWTRELSMEPGLIHLLIGPKGCGKTAIALSSAWPEYKGDTFAVYWRLHPSDDPNALWRQCGEVCARVLSGYIGQRPRLFLDLVEQRQLAVLRLLVFEAGSVERALVSLFDKGLPREGSGHELIRTVERWSQLLTLDGLMPEENEIPRLVTTAVPAGHRNVAFWVDVQEAACDAGCANAMRRVLLSLAEAGASLVVLIPEEMQGVREALRRFAMSESIIAWSASELRALLERRLGGEQRLSAREQLKKVIGYDIEGWLIHAAKCLPGRIMVVGMEMLKCLGEKGEEVSPPDLEKILGRYPGEAALEEGTLCHDAG